MRIRPTPEPAHPRATAITMTDAFETWLVGEGIYRRMDNQRQAATNMMYAAVRAIRGGESDGSAADTIADVKAEVATRRLRRTARALIALADQLED